MQVFPRSAARALPSTSARCWAVTVKKLDPLTSSHKSKPVLFLYKVTKVDLEMYHYVPVLGHIRQIILDNRPYKWRSCGWVTIVDQPFGIGNESCSTKSRTISLRTTPRSSESRLVCIELGLSKTTTGETAWGIRDGLEICLSTDVILNLRLKRGRVAVYEGIDDALES